MISPSRLCEIRSGSSSTTVGKVGLGAHARPGGLQAVTSSSIAAIWSSSSLDSKFLIS